MNSNQEPARDFLARRLSITLDEADELAAELIAQYRWTRLTVHANASGGIGLVVSRAIDWGGEVDAQIERETLVILPAYVASHALSIAKHARRIFRLDGAIEGTIERAFETAVDDLAHETGECYLAGQKNPLDKATHVHVERFDRHSDEELDAAVALGEDSVILVDREGEPIFSGVVCSGDYEPRRLADWIGAAFGLGVFEGRGVIVE